MRGVLKALAMILVLLTWLLVWMGPVSNTPLTPSTIPYIMLLAVLMTISIVAVASWDYIAPKIFRSWRLGQCWIEEEKYVICRRRFSSKYIGKVFLELIPETTVAVMPKERREALAQTLLGIFSGAGYEGGICFIAVRDPYHNDVIKVLQRELARKQMFASSRNPAIQQEIERIQSELKLLMNVPMILRGFYIAMVRDYDEDKDELIRKLDAHARSIQGALSSAGLRAEILTGKKLETILDALEFGVAAFEAPM